MDLEEIKLIVKRRLSEKRFYHSMCVMDMCEKLSRIYNVDTQKAKLVGLTHDIAKEMPKAEMFDYVKNNHIEISDIEKKCPGLLHSKIGADMVKKQFDFSSDMVNAIRNHTTGAKNMDMLSKILYMADWIGLDRKFDDTDFLRNLAFKDINSAIIYAINQTIKEKINKNELLHIDSILARNSLLK